ncbi:MAG: hypothetical protein J07HX5_01706 [halophilic archaeon J07HX5]|jgi:hypothetical protein|nr:MAG: hypothetical protein J07HX5_01706 [halophilic archaeon J07HX5]
MTYRDATHPNFYLMCDGTNCSNLYGISSIYTELELVRSDAEAAGWSCDDVADYCPDCK